MTSLPVRSGGHVAAPDAAALSARRWLAKHYDELLSRAKAAFCRLSPDSRDEAVAEVMARSVAWAHSAARRGRLHLVTPYWFVIYARRQFREGRRFAGYSSRCVMSHAAKVKHGVKVSSLDEPHEADDRRPVTLRETLANRDAENPYEQTRRAMDYPTIFAMESLSPKAIATFEFLVATKSEGRQLDLAAELHVSGGRITQLKDELGEALARHDYGGPLGARPSSKKAGEVAQAHDQR